MLELQRKCVKLSGINKNICALLLPPCGPGKHIVVEHGCMLNIA